MESLAAVPAAAVPPKTARSGAAPSLWCEAAFAAILLVGVLGNQIRLLGAGGALAVTALFWFLMVLRFPRTVNPFLLALTAWGSLYVVLSAMAVLPPAYTVLYDTALIPQQAFYVFALLPAVLVAEAWWRSGFGQAWLKRRLIVLALATLTASPLFELVGSGSVDGMLYQMFVTLKNNLLIHMVALSALVFLAARSWPWVGATMLYLFVALGVASYMQNLLAVFLILGFRLLHALAPGHARTAAIAIPALIAVGILFGMPRAEAIWQWDANTGIRLLFWRNALEAVGDTAGLGIGFGREAIRQTYEVGRLLVFGDIRDPAFAMIGTHSAFTDAALRLGVVGGVLLVLYVLSLVPRRGLPPAVASHAATVFGLCVLCLSVNVALQSPTYLFGVAFAMGYLQAVNRLPVDLLPAGRSRTPQRRYSS